MSLSGDDRAQSVQVGAVILFGFVVLAMAGYQAQVVPAENEEVEYRHSEQVQEQLGEVRNAVVAAASGFGQPVSVSLGARFPDRTFFVNPPPATGRLETTTVGTGAVELANVSAARSDVRDYWNGSRSVQTRALTYRPNYRLFDGPAATVLSNTLLYNQFEGANATLSGQEVVDGNRLTLVALNGSLSEGGVSPVSIDPEPVSLASRTITVANDSTGPPTIRLPTRLSVAEWESALSGELDPTGAPGNDRYVRDVVAVPGSQAVHLVLENATYRLRMAKVGVGTGAADTTSAYVTPVTGDGTTVTEGTTQQVVVEVRDAYNNPVTGETVNVTVGGGGTVATDNRAAAQSLSGVTTDAAGQVTLEYAAPNVTGSATQSVGVRVGIDHDATALGAAGYDASTPRNATVDLTVANTDGSGTGGGNTGANINPNAPGAVILQQAAISSCTGGADCRVDVTFENTDGNDTRRFAEARFNFYSVDSQSQNKRTPPELVEFTNTTGGGTQDLTSASSGGQYRPVNVSIGPGGTATVPLRFYETTTGTTEFDVEQGDFFVTSVVFDDGTSATYFVAPIENDPPTASLSNNVTSPATGDPIEFDASGSSDPDGTVEEYRWDFQDTDDTWDTTWSSDATVVHSYATSGSKTVQVQVRDDDGATANTTTTVSVTGGGVADPGFAFEDVNQNGLYDSGTDISLADSQVTDGSYDAGANGLVIPDSVGGGSISSNSIDFRGDGVTIGVDVTGTNNGVTLDAGAGTLDATNVAIDSQRDRTVSITGGVVDVSGSTVTNDGTTSVSATGGDLTATGATVTSNRDRSVSLTASGSVTVDSATITSDGSITVDAQGGALDADSVSITSNRFRSIQLNSKGDMDIENAALSTWGFLNADLGKGSATLYVSGASIDDLDDELVYDPNGVTVDGSPSSGTVSQ